MPMHRDPPHTRDTRHKQSTRTKASAFLQERLSLQVAKIRKPAGTSHKKTYRTPETHRFRKCSLGFLLHTLGTGVRGCISGHLPEHLRLPRRLLLRRWCLHHSRQNELLRPLYYSIPTPEVLANATHWSLGAISSQGLNTEETSYQLLWKTNF